MKNEECRMKNKSLTPNPSPKGEGSRMKNEKLEMKNVEPLARRSDYSSFFILHFYLL